jgi:hypothetical protein
VLTVTLTKIDTKEFQDFFNYVFVLFVPKRGGLINVDYAAGYFSILYGKFKLTAEFIEFMRAKTDFKGLTFDQWQNFPRLLNDIGDKFPAGYEYEIGAWPGLFDAFYEFFCNKKGIKFDKPDY